MDVRDGPTLLLESLKSCFYQTQWLFGSSWFKSLHSKLAQGGLTTFMPKSSHAQIFFKLATQKDWSTFTKKAKMGVGSPTLPWRAKKRKKCKLCSRWHWLRYRWNDQRSWLIADRYCLNVAKERPCFALYASAVPGCSLLWNTLLTKRFPIFLSRLNEINGGCEKILPVSGSFKSNLKFFRVIDFAAWLWGWNVRVNGILSFFSLCDFCSADCRSICWARWWPAWSTDAG